jgi:hypothetical protein
MCQNVWRYNHKLWQQKSWLLHHDRTLPHTSFLTWEFITKNNMSSPTHPTHLTLPPVTFLFPRLKINWKFHYFETTEADWGRIRGSAEHPHRTWLPGCI